MTNQNVDLKRAGLKVTLPRLNILSILSESADEGAHLSAEDVYQRLRDAGDDVGLATVYRVLTQFETAGLVERHNFESGHSVFELATDDHHDHMVDVDNNEIIEFVDEEIEARHVVLAIGAPQEPAWPEWARSAAPPLPSVTGPASTARIRHIFDPGFELVDDPHDAVIAVVGPPAEVAADIDAGPFRDSWLLCGVFFLIAGVAMTRFVPGIDLRASGGPQVRRPAAAGPAPAAARATPALVSLIT